MRLIALMTYFIAGVRGYAVTSLTSLTASPVRRWAGSAGATSRRLQSHQPPLLRCPTGGCGTLRRPPPAYDPRWLCGGKPPKCKRRGGAPSCCAGAEPPPKPVLILGAGWVGSRLAQSLLDDDVPVIVTNRPGTKPDQKPPYFRPVDVECPPAERLEFDLNDEATWELLPPSESLGAVIVTFPMATPDAFWDAYLGAVAENGRPVLCYSTTSVYRVDTPGQLVDEHTPLRETARAAGERYIQERGATVLTISGIFGDQRTPRAICTCLSTYTQSGGALNGRKRVNMVHVDDIVAASRACLEQPQRGRRINVAGHHFALAQLISHCKHPEVADLPDTDLSSKCVCSDVLLNELMPGYDFKPAVPGGANGQTSPAAHASSASSPASSG